MCGLLRHDAVAEYAELGGSGEREVGDPAKRQSHEVFDEGGREDPSRPTRPPVDLPRAYAVETAPNAFVITFADWSAQGLVDSWPVRTRSLLEAISIVPKPFPVEFRGDVVVVARQGDQLFGGTQDEDVRVALRR